MKDLNKIIVNSKDRFELSINFIDYFNFSEIAEIGVYKGDYSFEILSKCSGISKYFMIDPWRNLYDWNKPLNRCNEEFDLIFSQAKDKTSFAKNKIHILRGKTTEVIDFIEDESLDFIYIDGDHTLRGITIDLISSWKKVKKGGIILGDDFCPSIWQHNKNFEPTLIFPFALYFAEAVNAEIFFLPYNQFLIFKNHNGFSVTDFTGGSYENINLLSQLKMF